jgi:hypothetical protein
MLENCISAVSVSDLGWTLAASLQLTVVVISHSQQWCTQEFFSGDFNKLS